MTPIKTALAGLAATGLLLAQPAVAAGHRSGSATGESEQLAGGGFPRAATPALIAILAVAIVSVIAASSGHHHNNNHPVSP